MHVKHLMAGSGPCLAKAAGAFMPGFASAPMMVQPSPQSLNSPAVTTVATPGSPPCTPQANVFRSIGSGFSEPNESPQLSHSLTATTLNYGNSVINLDTQSPPNKYGRMPDSYTCAPNSLNTPPAQDTQVDTPSSKTSASAEALQEQLGQPSQAVPTQQTTPPAPTQQSEPVTQQMQPSQAVPTEQTAPPAPTQQSEPTIQQTQPSQAVPTQQTAPPAEPSQPATQQSPQAALQPLPSQAVPTQQTAPPAPAQQSELTTQQMQPSQAVPTQQTAPPAPTQQSEPTTQQMQPSQAVPTQQTAPPAEPSQPATQSPQAALQPLPGQAVPTQQTTPPAPALSRLHHLRLHSRVNRPLDKCSPAKQFLLSRLHHLQSRVNRPLNRANKCSPTDTTEQTATPDTKVAAKAAPKPNKYQDGTYWKPPESIYMHTCVNCYLKFSCLRLRNYVKPNSKGEVKASDNVLKMFKTDKGRHLDSNKTTTWQSVMLTINLRRGTSKTTAGPGFFEESRSLSRKTTCGGTVKHFTRWLAHRSQSRQGGLD